MRQESMSLRDTAERTVRDIRRKTRKQYSAEEKIRIVVSGLRSEDSIAELCRREGIAESLYYSWSKEFLEAGKRRLAGDAARQASRVPETSKVRVDSHDQRSDVISGSVVRVSNNRSETPSSSCPGGHFRCEGME